MAIPSDWSILYHRGTQGYVQFSSDPRAICPHCRTASTFSIRAQIYVHQPTMNKTDVHLILDCNYAPCRKTVYIGTSVSEGYSEPRRSDDFFMYPSSALDAAHPSVPIQVADDWTEAQKAMQASAPKASAVMLRRVLYSVLMDKGCKLQPLKDGMKQLIDEQRLPAIFDKWLPAIKDDGHDGAHPDRALQVSSENVVETMEYTAQLLRFIYIEPYEFQKRNDRNAPPSLAPVATQ